MIGIYILVFFALILLYGRHVIKRRQQPPGPLGFPFVGLIPYKLFDMIFKKYIPETSTEQYFIQMKKMYGDIWSIEIGSQRIITLASLDLINEAFLMPNNAKLFSGRPKNEIYKLFSQGLGILFSDGELWQKNRQLAIKALRDLGMGKKDLENHICNEADELIEYLKQNSASSLSSPTTFVKAISNVISRLVFNERNEYDDPILEKYVKNLKHLAHSGTGSKMIGIPPTLFKTKLARWLFKEIDYFIQSNQNCVDFVKQKCLMKMKLQTEDLIPNCVFDYFWKLRYKEDSETKYEDIFNDISHTMFDLYNAGTDTTTNTLGFCCLMLGLHEEVQEDLRSEILVMTNDHTRIDMNMKKECPKLLSFIDEIQRYCFLVPKIHRRTLETTIFQGYKIEPNDIVFGDLATISRDPRLFENPDDFNPYRFMNKSRTKYVPNKSLIPFGVGKRVCLGESIAGMELFLFLSRLILTFNISLPKETMDNIDKILEGSSGVVHAPLDHDIVLTQRSV